MLEDFLDIREKIKEPPLWFDGEGTPRYKPFHPSMVGVYNSWALLVLISCQACSEPMRVGQGWSRYDQYRWFREGDRMPDPWTLESLAVGYHYGDPPFHYCPGAGETMNCVDLKIEEAWTRDNKEREWARDPEVEKIDIFPDWARERKV